jgi:hypothetical protein
MREVDVPPMTGHHTTTTHPNPWSRRSVVAVQCVAVVASHSNTIQMEHLVGTVTNVDIIATLIINKIIPRMGHQQHVVAAEAATTIQLSTNSRETATITTAAHRNRAMTRVEKMNSKCERVAPSEDSDPSPTSQSKLSTWTTSKSAPSISKRDVNTHNTRIIIISNGLITATIITNKSSTIMRVCRPSEHAVMVPCGA